MIEQVDFAILDWIQAHLKCGFLDFLMPKVTLFAEHGIFFIAVGVILLIFRSKRRCGITLLSGMAGGYLIANMIIKKVVARPRPFSINTAIELIVSAPKDFSFPSGHTLNAFIAATILMYFDKRLGIPALVIAVLVAFSRMYLYVHYPSDVFAAVIMGIAFGIAAIVISNLISKKWKERKTVKTE